MWFLLLTCHHAVANQLLPPSTLPPLHLHPPLLSLLQPAAPHMVRYSRRLLQQHPPVGRHRLSATLEPSQEKLDRFLCIVRQLIWTDCCTFIIAEQTTSITAAVSSASTKHTATNSTALGKSNINTRLSLGSTQSTELKLL